jgi:hypothetical protein
VWLAVDFDAFPDGDANEQAGLTVETEVSATESASSEPQIEYIGRVEQMPDGVYLFISVGVFDPSQQFRFRGQLGASFTFAEASAFEEAAVRSTLMWMAFPYAREMVASVTARSPHTAYFLPPMTRMPDPAAVTGAPSRPSPTEPPSTNETDAS